MKINNKHCLVSLLCYAFFLSATAQQKQVTGRVTDSTFVPIPGVNVQLTHKQRGTTTNFDGEFSLRAAPKDTLVFSYMGYQTQKVAVGQQEHIPLILNPGANALQEVVINAGYYTTTERERTGNIAKVTAEEIELQPLVSPLQALQGRMAGVEVSPGSDLPGAAPTIRIRGQNSLRDEGNYPLYIIDGMPLNATPISTNSNLSASGLDPLSTLDLANIESIEVLKDADATAIYGSRGANGVILITTKKGTGQKGVQARIYSGVATVPNSLDLLTTQRYVQLRQQAFVNDGVEPSETNAYDLLLWDQNRTTDWQDYFLGGSANITNLSLSAQGGNAQTHYRLTGALMQQGTIYPTAMQYRKLTGGVNLGHQSKDGKLQLDLALNYGLDDNELMADGVNFRNLAFSLAPNAPALFKEGQLNWEEWGEAGLNNPLEGFYNKGTSQGKNLIANMQLRYRLWESLRFTANLGYTNYHSRELVKMPARSYNPTGMPQNISLHTNNERSSWLLEPQVDFNRDFGKLAVHALAGITLQDRQDYTFSVEGHNYVAEALIGNLGAAQSLLNPQERTNEYHYMAGYARVGINWNSEFYVNLTGRRDGSSRFGPDKRFANFGAVGAAWIFTEENFFKKHTPWLSLGKLRASYGTTGNDQIPDYGYLDAYEATQGPGGLYPTALANPNYSWEVNKKLEAGLQLGFFKHRIHIGLSGYRNRSSSQLVGYPLPSAAGFTSVQANLGATVENHGWEVELSARPLGKGKLKWQTSFNLTLPKNELVRYPGLESSPYAQTYRVGQPLNIAFLYQYEGLNPDTGLYGFTDVNGDGNYDFEDRVVIQDRTRQYFGGWQNSFAYQGFSLDFLWEFVKQEGTFATLFKAGFPQAQLANVAPLLEGGSPYQTLSQSSEASQAYGRAVSSNFVVEDASFLRLKTLSLGYTLPKRFTKKLPVQRLKLFVNGQNLLTLSDYSGMDPAMPYGGTSFGGLRSLTAGVQLNF